MLMKKLLISALLAAGTIGAAATPVASAAATHFEFSFGTPVRHEYVPAHRPGYVWVPEHRGVAGHWERARGYRGQGPRGDRHGSHWDRHGSHWEPVGEPALDRRGVSD